MKLAICRFPGAHVPRIVAGDRRLFGLIQDRSRKVGSGLPQRQTFELGSHQGDLFNLIQIK